MRGTSAPLYATSRTVAQVSLTVAADMQFRHTVGLRARAKRAVLAVLEAALEIRKLGAGNVHKPLIIRVGSHVVMYSLDLEQESANTWRAEPVHEAALN